jgi:pimeloyl-ACP methyl ester carboxylesterase
MAAPAVSGLELMVEQNVALARIGGTPVHEQEHLRIFVGAAYAAVLEEDAEALEASIREAFGAYWDRLTPERRSVVPEREAFVALQVAAQVSALSSPWFRSILESDAGADWARVSVPVLGLYGGRDVQLAAARNTEALSDALGLGGNDDPEIIVFPDANHLFQAAETGNVEEYATLGTDFTPDFLPLRVDWIVEHSGVRK